MKLEMRHIIILAVTAVALLLGACDDNSGKKKYSPQQPSSTMSDEQRQEAIEAKKAEISIDPHEMMTGNDVKLTVLPPVASGDITEELSEYIGVKMLEIIAANGIGGLNNVPGFALAAKIHQNEKKTTGTAPQKMIASYTLSYQVINLVTGDVYATASQQISGAGDSFEQATRNAIKSIKNSQSIQQMLQAGSQKIIDWFNNNLASFKSQVDAACGHGDYALALSLIESVPEKATQAFAYAQSRHNEILNKFLMQIAANELNAMRQAITEANGAFSKDVYAHLSLISSGSPQYVKAQELLASYEAAVESANQNKISKEDLEARRRHEIEVANIETERLKALYQAQATERAISQNVPQKDFIERGFWSKLGVRIITVLDKITGL